jgi:ribosomal protein S12 methylthiotransferase
LSLCLRLSGVRLFCLPLGCPKNDVDAEYMLGLLAQAGATIVAAPEDADVVLVNTCAFIQPAVEEAIDNLLSLADLKSRGVRALICSGCLPQRFAGDLAAELPEVDAFMGPGEVENVVAVVADALAGHGGLRASEPRFIGSAAVPRRALGPSWRATAKIADGCGHRCTFCTIPAIRGPFRSRTPDDVVAEVEALLEAGAREICLVAQDTSGYGADLGTADGLPALLERLSPIVGAGRWLRVQYLHPDRLGPRLIDTMLGLDAVVPYFDLPFQHASPQVLRLMGRAGSRAEYEALVGAIRDREPDAAVRATFITGFPGETDADFHDLLGFVADVKADHVAVFPYWPEDGTPAARLPGRVSDPEVRGRHEELVATAHSASQACGSRFVGRTLRVLVEAAMGDGAYEGRSFRDAPEVDGVVRLSSPQVLDSGAFTDALIMSAEVSDLLAVIEASRRA